MTHYKPNPTYFRVVWNNTTPNNYATLTDTQAGGLDCVSADKYNSQVSITGNSSTFTLVDGDHFFINGHKIVFASTDNTVDEIIVKINLGSVFTKVIANKSISSSYVTLMNSPRNEGHAITLEDGEAGANALIKIGFTAGVYKTFPNMVGAAISGVTAGDNVVINGVTITLSNNTQAAIVDSINESTFETGVVAYAAAGKLQLGSVNGIPWTTSANPPFTINPSAIGFPAGVYSGTPATLAQSQAKTLANMRWLMVMNSLQASATPFLIDDFAISGNFDGTSSPTTLSWTVGYEHPDQIRTVATSAEPDAGQELVGAAAIKRAVARGLIATHTTNAKLWDPTTVVRNHIAVRPNTFRISTLTADGIDTVTNIAAVEANITVDVITYD